ncbi:MAG TPA: Ig-like domain-containing protein [Longimicrobiaceae bacterium]|jgi:hypothetical protein
MRNGTGRASRTRGALLACLALLAAAACSDSTGPSPVADLNIGGAPAAPLRVGDTLTLSIALVNAAGSPVTGRAVTWRSSAPAVASVTQEGRVAALSPGQAWIAASAGGVADSVSVTVASISTSQACLQSSAALTLAVGEVRQVVTDAAGIACIQGPAGGGEFTVVAFNGRTAGSLPLEVRGSGIASPAGSASVGVAPWAAAPDAAAGGRPRDFAWESALRAREGRELAPYVPAARAAAARRAGIRASLALADPPAVGSLLRINASIEACDQPNNRVGRVAAVTERAIVVADTANPAGGFTDAEYREFGLSFDTLVYPVDVANFGAPTDIDANGRTILFFTRAVNALTERDSDSFVGGFFYARDLFPRADTEDFEGCAGSNFGELFYLLAPDPGGQINGNQFSKAFVLDNTVGTVAHEFQHLISAARRLYVVQTENFDEEVWLNEGLSHIAEELVFYRAAGLSPGQNLTADRLRSSERVRAAFNAYASSNFGRYGEYLRDPEANSPYGSDDELGTRGAAWAFLRYAADRRGGDQAALWNRLVNNTLTGIPNLRAALGAEPVEWARDWTTSVYTDDLLPSAPAPFQQPSWHFRNIFSALSTNAVYPLRTRTLADAVTTSVTLAPGGGAFFRLAVPSGGRGEVRITSGAGAPGGGFSATVVRTR